MTCADLRVCALSWERQVFAAKVHMVGIAGWSLAPQPLLAYCSTMSRHSDSVKHECLRLRIEERRSIREIKALTGVSKGTLSIWLKQYPLTDEEQYRKRHKNLKKDRGEKSQLSALAAAGMTRAQKARVAETAVLLRLTLRGLAAFSSPFNEARTDFLVLTPTGTKRLQVKWAREGAQGLPTVVLLCSDGVRGRRPYQDGEIDFLVGYDLYSDTAYVWAWDEIKHLKNSVTVSPEAAERWDKLSQ